jgi:membrane protein YdbS with pleckstrin-like domain
MEKLEFKPEIEQRTLWFLTWVIIFVLGTPAWILPLLFIDREGVIFFIGFLTVWLIAMIIIPIWIPAAFRALEYTIDEDGVKMSGGVVWKKHVTVPYSKITNVDITRGPLQRYYKIGTIHVQTAGSGGKQGEKAELKLAGVRDLEKIREVIIDNIKGIDYSGTVKRKTVKESPDEGRVFEEMLGELKDIKKLLGKNR